MSDSFVKKSWKYVNPDVESSYRENNLGKTLYKWVRDKKPKKIIEFGVLNGYSTIAMALALKANGFGKLIGYDLWDKYPYKHTTKEKTLENLKRYGVADVVELRTGDFYKWPGEEFDFMHLDISNTGLTIDHLEDKHHFRIHNEEVTVLFEGGSEERDNVAWINKYGKRKIADTKCAYVVIEPKYPSISQLI